MDEGDRQKVAAMLHEVPEALDDGYMLSLIAEKAGEVLAVLRGWLGHPHGHIEVFDVDMGAPAKQRFEAGVWLLRTFEALLGTIGARGWTAMTNRQNHAMCRLLSRRGAATLPGHHQVFVKRWR